MANKIRPSDSRSKKPHLVEGLREGDLADLVLPLISVDEFVSKVDPTECIVFGFYVHDKEAAADFNRFLQKSAVPVLDTDISPAPDTHGYYVVFVELMDNDRLATNMTVILAEIKGLVNIDDWQMRIRKIKHLVPFSEDNLADSLKKISKDDRKDDIVEFFRPSLLSNVSFEANLIILERNSERFVHRIVDFDRLDSLMQSQNLLETPISYNIRSVAKSNRLVYLLGEGWTADRLGSFICIHNADDPRALLLAA